MGWFGIPWEIMGVNPICSIKLAILWIVWFNAATTTSSGGHLITEGLREDCIALRTTAGGIDLAGPSQTSRGK
jgi:hypothetical protein